MASRRSGRQFRRRVLELSLSSVQLLETGGNRGRGSTTHLLTVRLVWPRPMIAERVAARSISAADGEFERASAWTDRVLFKETVEGRFGLEVTVSEALSAGQAADLLAFIGATTNKVFESELGGAIESSIGARLASLPFAFLSKRLGNVAKNFPAGTIARGVLDLDSEMVSGRKDIDLAVKMVAPEPLTKVTRRRRQGKVQTKRRVLLEAGQDNGVVHINGRFYE